MKLFLLILMSATAAALLLGNPINIKLDLAGLPVVGDLLKARQINTDSWEEDSPIYEPPATYPDYKEDSEYPEMLSKDKPSYPKPSSLYSPHSSPEIYEEEIEYSEEYPKNPPPYSITATKYPVKTPKYPPLTQKPVHPGKYVGRTYPTPKYFKRLPTYKHLRATYPTMTKAKFSWTAWSEWADCSATCNTGIKKRTRNCLPGVNNGVEVPKPGSHPNYVKDGNSGSNYEGYIFVSDDDVSETEGVPYSNKNYECEGNSVQVEQCSKEPCPINGGWSKWEVWSLCSASCGDGGLQRRVRDCNEPVPANGGKVCQGVSEEFVLCTNPKPCPVDGNWGVWSAWSSCSKSCGYGGSTTRSRSCSDPTASYGGKECMGPASEVKYCFETNCNNWSPWTEWSTCTAICGIKPFHQRNRQCLLQNNIVYGKNIIEYCEGEPVEFKYCDKPRHIFEPAKDYKMNFPGCGVIHGACVNSWFVAFSRESPDFDMNKSWMEYKTGFGKPPHDFYLGNEYIYCMSKLYNYFSILEIISKSGRKLDYESPISNMGSEADNYALNLSCNSSGIARGMPFSTYDRDNDQNDNNCAKIHGGGWWYDSCYNNANLFGDYTKHFEMKIHTPDNCLKKARVLIQRNPTIDDVNIHPFNPPKYPNKSYKEETKSDVY